MELRARLAQALGDPELSRLGAGLVATLRIEGAGDDILLRLDGGQPCFDSSGAADIVIAAAGVPHLITADMVKPGAAVVDVGVSRTDEGRLAGDVHPDVWEVAGHVSPNPGGVGPLTRAFLLVNVVERAEQMLASGSGSAVSYTHLRAHETN